MTKQEKITASHGGIATALVAAQMEMGKAAKQSENSHFRSKYADLGNVMDACLPALNKHGIAVIQPTGESDAGRFVKTVLIHSESGDKLECEVPLILQKNDMQGYGSAVTYARRYGLMTMAGIAPEDDDGNAAANAAPKVAEQRPKQPNHAKTRDGMLAAIQKYGPENVQADPRFTTDIALLRTQAPEMAAQVEAEIATQSENKKSVLEDDEIPYLNNGVSA